MGRFPRALHGRVRRVRAMGGSVECVLLGPQKSGEVVTPSLLWLLHRHYCGDNRIGHRTKRGKTSLNGLQFVMLTKSANTPETQ